MADASRSEPRERAGEPRLSLGETWRRLNAEQRVAGVGALLVVVSTFGPFSFVEAAEILTAGGVLLLLRKRAEGKVFHVPFGDGSVIMAAGAWAALLIFIRSPDRPLGQTLLAMLCAAVMGVAGLRERAKRPPDDLPQGVAEPGPPAAPPPDPGERAAPVPAPPAGGETAETQALPARVLPPATPRGRRAAADQPPLWDEPTD
ncbi:MAG TPA: hypothetical protein VF712_19025 [Thermoleophilaceae bacterium]|jgi:hypothetical protein